MECMDIFGGASQVVWLKGNIEITMGKSTRIPKNSVELYANLIMENTEQLKKLVVIGKVILYTMIFSRS